MNKFVMLAGILSVGMTFSACGMFEEDPYVGGEFAKLVQKEQERSDTIRVVDNWGIEDTYVERIYSDNPEYFYFETSGSINEIKIEMRVECDEDGGKMTVSCLSRNGIWHYSPDIVFKDLDGNKMTDEGDTTERSSYIKGRKKTGLGIIEMAMGS